MLQYEELDMGEHIELHNKAYAFLRDHTEHIYGLINKETPRIPPSGSDMFHPELWKSIHWAWFLSKESNK